MGPKWPKEFKMTFSNKTQRNKILEASFKNTENTLKHDETNITPDETNISCGENFSTDETSKSLKLKNEDFLLFNSTVQGIC